MTRAISLFRSLLREGRRFNSYPFSRYIIRRSKEEFRKNAAVKDPALIKELLTKAEINLGIAQRQGAISRLYQRKKTVLEA